MLEEINMTDLLLHRSERSEIHTLEILRPEPQAKLSKLRAWGRRLNSHMETWTVIIRYGWENILSQGVFGDGVMLFPVAYEIIWQVGNPFSSLCLAILLSPAHILYYLEYYFNIKLVINFVSISNQFNSISIDNKLILLLVFPFVLLDPKF